MSDVKAAVRALRVFETFANEARPMSLSELAAALSIPPSSCLLLIRTLLKRGYLYETAARGGYYPTRRMAELSERITRHDPVVERLMAVLEALRDRTAETVTLSKRQGTRGIYLAILDSPQILRPSVTVGQLRPLHATAAGKALLGALESADRDRVFDALDIKRFTSKTLVSRTQLESELDRMAQRGWYSNDGESVSDLSAVAVPVRLDKEIYSIAILGPSSRLNSRFAELAQMLVRATAVLNRPARRSVKPGDAVKRRVARGRAGTIAAGRL